MRLTIIPAAGSTPDAPRFTWRLFEYGNRPVAFGFADSVEAAEKAARSFHVQVQRWSATPQKPARG